MVEAFFTFGIIALVAMILGIGGLIAWLCGWDNEGR
jgi:hypothetical protein